jgi:hypothetical protein
MAQVLHIRTVEDLHKSILLQRSVTRKVTQELDDIIKKVVTEENKDDDEYLARMFMEHEVQLLTLYATRPTLIEYERSPSLSGVMEAGATFGVTAIVGDVLLANVRILADVFPKAHRSLLLILLDEISKPSSEDVDLVETMMRSMRIELATNPDPDEHQRLVRAMLTPLAKALLTVMLKYNLLAQPNGEDEGYIVTALGQRVLLHLFAAQKFVEAVTEAHHRLQRTMGPRDKASPTRRM